ncbi:MAG: GNAT family N-acetyltransferase [Desulfobacterales bacterium]|nr:MAG: GNAT family N-acetyltransferase [Desulfobacterales bacterium]
MLKVDVYKDLEDARRIWQRYWPQECLFDLWAVRNCFQLQFNHSPYFLVATENRKFRGMLALSWIEEEQCFGHFPGEVWHGKTWLEQNKILASDPAVFSILVNHIPATAKIRYLTDDPNLAGASLDAIDEIGYLFHPPQHHYSFQDYLQCFSGKTRKKLRCELNRLTAGGVAYRYDCLEDVVHLFRMNLENFREESYFYDVRFLRAFENLVSWLHANRMLRVTTVLIGGRIAAVDVGAVWNQTYTVLAGGAHADFPGVAKLINFHHLEWACQQRFKVVDFLCGEFNWKHRFHLTARPLYRIENLPIAVGRQDTIAVPRVACAVV